MIVLSGVSWGTADEIAAALGPDIKPATVRSWSTRDGLQSATVPGRGRGIVRYRLDQAAAIEAAKRHSPRGRPRRVDFHPALV